ncbi:hypothetical protein [Bradyrhizobium sp. NAS96.2]|nr:hypothetical protein [Bradyrhizobium sp. NAS96.2]
MSARAGESVSVDAAMAAATASRTQDTLVIKMPALKIIARIMSAAARL